MSIGSFKIVNGAVDSFNSATGTIFVNAATINASNGITAQNITATKSLSGYLTNDSIKVKQINLNDSVLQIGDPLFFQIGHCASCPTIEHTLSGGYVFEE